jgi:hypothetical protein
VAGLEGAEEKEEEGYEDKEEEVCDNSVTTV